MKLAKAQIRRIIKEELSKVLNEANRDDRLPESVLTKKKKYFSKITGVYLTTGKAFLGAVRDMAAITQETGNLEQALEQLEANVDAGKYTPWKACLQTKLLQRLKRMWMRVSIMIQEFVIFLQA